MEDRPALRLQAIRKEAERAIREGRKLSPHLIHAMTLGAKG